MQIVLGPPGTGKTSTLLNIVDEAFMNGARPEKTAFLAFTKKAATEAKDRAKIKFNMTDNKLVFFRTIHSLAFRQLGLNKSQVMQKEHFVELGNVLGVRVTGYIDMTEGSVAYGMDTGDRLLFLEGLARTKQQPLRKTWEESGSEEIDWFELERLSKALVKYKQARGLFDFTDMLEMFCTQGYVPELDYLLVDEAQDLSPLQWQVINLLMKKANKVVICGDDDQSIFSWSGADTNYFINLEGSVLQLDKSWRVPGAIQNMALDIVNQISKRRPKVWEPKQGVGEISWHDDLDDVPLDKGNWLILARNGYMLRRAEEHCITNGFSFDGKYSPLKSPTLTAIRYWEELRKGGSCSMEQIKKINGFMIKKINTHALAGHEEIDMGILELKGKVWSTDIWHKALDRISPYEREYFIAARRAGEPLLKTPRIRLSTIHGAKGGESDNVLLFTDLAPRTYDEFLLRPDDEHRVFYVGVTRAKENLHLLQPKTNKAFLI